jgi:Mg2+ and Co2+ transporter CorA
MLSDRLLDAMNKLDISKPSSVRQFRRVIRQTLEIFLRFTHRYWFHEVSEHVQAKDLFRMINRHLDTDRLYAELREAIEDMSRYHDSDLLRRQGETMVRLTVVATLGLVGVTTTSFFGMNLIAAAESPLLTKIGYFLVVLIPTVALTAYTVLKSRRLADFLETLADERRSSRAKLAALVDVWKAGPNP